MGKRVRGLPITRLGLSSRFLRLWMGKCPEWESKTASKGKVMTQDKAEQHVIFASTILLLLFAGLTLFIASIARANPGPDSAASSATDRANCAACHGPDGGRVNLGKTHPTPDLRP